MRINGGNKSMDEKREKMKRLGEEYAIKLGIGKIVAHQELEQILNLTAKELRNMDAEDCGEAAYLLSKSITAIQLEINRVQADINWCNEYIDWIITKEISNIPGYLPFVSKRLLAIQQNDVTQKLYTIVTNAKYRLDSVGFITDKLKGQLQALEALLYIKKGQR